MHLHLSFSVHAESHLINACSVLYGALATALPNYARLSMYVHGRTGRSQNRAPPSKIKCYLSFIVLLIREHPTVKLRLLEMFFFSNLYSEMQCLLQFIDRRT